MKLQRHGLVVGLVAGALALSACGSDNTDSNSAGSGSGSGSSASGASVDCASGTLSWDGSSAQKTAVTQWVQQYQNQCSNASINYQGQGSGAGRFCLIGMFIANLLDSPSTTMPVAPIAAPAPGPNVPPPPAHDGPAFFFKVSAKPDGTFTVTNERNKFSKTYAAKAGAN